MSVAAIVPGEGPGSLPRVVGALRDGGVGRVVVVSPPRWTTELIDVALACGAEVVAARGALTDMRSSVEVGLAYLARPGRGSPTSLILATGDEPELTADLVARVAAAGAASPGSIVVPVLGGRRGYPVLIPWNVAIWLPSIPPRAGVDALIYAHGDAVVELPCDGPDDAADLAAAAGARRWSWPL